MEKQSSVSSIIEKNISEKDYESAIKTIKQEIEKIFVEKVNIKNSNYKHTNILSLVNTAENELSQKEYILLKKFYYIITENNCVEYELYQLMNIYSELKEVRGK